MTDDKKPREFWILDYTSKRTPGGNLVYEAYDYRLTSDSAVHVIEKSAYDELHNKLKIALAQMLKFRNAFPITIAPDGWSPQWSRELDEAIAKASEGANG